MPTQEKKRAGEGFKTDEGYVPTQAEKYLELVTNPEISSPAEIQASIVSRIMEAGDLDALDRIADAQATGAETILERPFVIENVTWMKGSPQYEQGSGVFVIIQARMQDTDETLAVTCGGENVLASLYRAHELGFPTFDGRVRRFRSARTSRGFDVLWLATAKAP